MANKAAIAWSEFPLAKVSSRITSSRGNPKSISRLITDSSNLGALELSDELFLLPLLVPGVDADAETHKIQIKHKINFIMLLCLTGCLLLSLKNKDF